MGGSASSQSTKDGDIENKKENNFGLVNVSSASSGTWNLPGHSAGLPGNAAQTTQHCCAAAPLLSYGKNHAYID